MRFSQLQVRIGGISKKMLAQTLRRLQDNGLILHRPVRPRDYELTPLGRTLLEPIQELVQWAETHTDELLSAAGRDSQATA